MNVVLLKDPVTGSTARIAAHLGLNCFEFLARISETEEISVIHAAPGFETGEHPASHSGIPILFPFPNRIRSGRYEWEGKQYELPVGVVGYEGSGNAIHGFCLDRPWRVLEQTESSVTAAFRISVDAPDRAPHWPCDGEIEVRYSLNSACLRADIKISNPGEGTLPWGFGTHAYFRVPLNSSSDPGHCTIHAPVHKMWELQDCLPTGEILDSEAAEALNGSAYFDTLKVDDVFTDVRAKNGVVECRIIDEKTGTQVVQRCDDAFREIVAFTPPWASAVCLEPYTCVTDAMNLQPTGVDAGLRVLTPGEEWNGWIEIAAGPVVC